MRCHTKHEAKRRCRTKHNANNRRICCSRPEHTCSTVTVLTSVGFTLREWTTGVVGVVDATVGSTWSWYMDLLQFTTFKEAVVDYGACPEDIGWVDTEPGEGRQYV